jgi:hypothetical protein
MRSLEDLAITAISDCINCAFTKTYAGYSQRKRVLAGKRAIGR